jgi:hypothetical protein
MVGDALIIFAREGGAKPGPRLVFFPLRYQVMGSVLANPKESIG